MFFVYTHNPACLISFGSTLDIPQISFSFKVVKT